MPGNYSQQVLEEIARIAREQGKEYAETLRKAFENGEITPGQNVEILVPIGNIDPSRFSFSTRALLGFGTPTAGVISNSTIVCLGLYTGGNSAIQYGVTADPKAKALYFTSALFSASAVVSGSAAVVSRTCHISGTAALSEAVGFAFMKLGNKAHLAALQLEGKPIPPKLRHLINPSRRPLSYKPGDLGFVMPRGMVSSDFIASIPFEKIGRVIGCGIAIYGYSRAVIVVYRYSQQFISKFRSNRKAKLIRKQKIFLVSKFQRIINKARSKRQPNLLFSPG